MTNIYNTVQNFRSEFDKMRLKKKTIAREIKKERDFNNL